MMYLCLVVLISVVATTALSCWLIHDLCLLPRWRQNAVSRNWDTFYAILQNEIAEAKQLASGEITSYIPDAEYYTVFGKKILKLPAAVWSIEEHK